MLSILHNQRGYRSSMDSFLLASFLTLIDPQTIIDLGTGNGILGLLLAGLYPKARIVGLEIQPELVEIARKNVENNGYADRMEVVLGDIKTCQQYFSPHSYDLVVTNPPYRRLNSGRINPDQNKAVARHELVVNLSQLITSVDYLLMPKGRFALIYHPGRLYELFTKLNGTDLAPRRIRFVHPYKWSDAKMVLLETSKGTKSDLRGEPPLIVYEEKGKYTEELKNIYSRWGLCP